MSIDLRENGEGYSELKNHIGHELVCASYGKWNNPCNVAIECVTCGIVLLDFDKPKPCTECHNVCTKKD